MPWRVMTNYNEPLTYGRHFGTNITKVKRIPLRYLSLLSLKSCLSYWTASLISPQTIHVNAGARGANLSWALLFDLSTSLKFLEYNDQLLLSLTKYISLRQPSHFLPHFDSLNVTCSNVEIDNGPAENDSNQLTVHLSTPQTGEFSIPSSSTPGYPQRGSSATSTMPRDPVSSRGILTHAAWLSEEIMRASEEKVNIAQASYDSVSDLVFCS